MSKKIILIIILINIYINILLGQTVLINSATQGGFESGSGFAANGWNVVNGAQTNRWYCITPGNPAVPFGGTNCAYISNTHPGGGTYAYTINSSSVVHFYRDITIPAGEPYLNLQFRFKGQGESIFDYLRVFSIPTTTTPVAGTELTSGQIGSTYYNLVGNTWTLVSINFCATPGSTIRLVFSWRNDNSVGTQPPAAVDNIHLTSSSTSPPCNLGTGVTTVASLPYSSGSGTTCGQVNDLTSSNTIICGSSSYLGGEDRVWIFTPTSSGNVTINLTSSGSWTGLMLYDGCPLTGSCLLGGTVCCVGAATNSSGNKTLNFCARSGVTYYLILDVFPSPNCNPYSNLTISAPSGTCSPNEDCVQSITVCSNSSFGGGTSGFGCNQELNTSNSGCLVGYEHHSNWYIFSPSTNGTISFTISPSGSQDYDFAVWGPYTSGSNASTVCPPSSAPLRCSYAGGSGNTGLGNGASDFTEGAGGDGWVAPISAVAGQVFVLLVDNFTADGASFNFTWTGTASMNCTPLPIELLDFNVKNLGAENLIDWNTATEINSDYFIIERLSNDEKEFNEIGKIKAMGNSHIQVGYAFIDKNPKYGINYYRLKSVNFDGAYEYSEIKAIKNCFESNFSLKSIYPNPTTNDFNIDVVTNLDDHLIITLTNIYGKKLQEFETSVNTGNNTIKINTDKIERGVLFVNISSKDNNINLTQKIVKQ